MKQYLLIYLILLLSTSINAINLDSSADIYLTFGSGPYTGDVNLGTIVDGSIISLSNRSFSIYGEVSVGSSSSKATVFLDGENAALYVESISLYNGVFEGEGILVGVNRIDVKGAGASFGTHVFVMGVLNVSAPVQFNSSVQFSPGADIFIYDDAFVMEDSLFVINMDSDIEGTGTLFVEGRVTSQATNWTVYTPVEISESGSMHIRSGHTTIKQRMAIEGELGIGSGSSLLSEGTITSDTGLGRINVYGEIA
eukprot:TRINITY_DN6844_c0_g1_i1.p1 TRINITY_DN6844_c0_g1~~TRINITY_DN6844_c0_g1_i1.p1  ORF type:complete len:261 (+),score=47.97 TRINITY_DN6844_c0_g1_i1:27-785(+)